MHGPRTAKSPTRAAKEVSDLTVEHSISVPESGATAFSFGPWCSCSRSQSQHSSRGGGTRRVGLREGKFYPPLQTCHEADSFANGGVKLHRTIRLPNDYSSGFGTGSGVLDTLASVPWFLVGIGGIAYEYVSSRLDILAMGYRARRGYRDLPVDEDAQVLRFEDEE